MFERYQYKLKPIIDYFIQKRKTIERNETKIIEINETLTIEKNEAKTVERNNIIFSFQNQLI